MEIILEKDYICSCVILIFGWCSDAFKVMQWNVKIEAVFCGVLWFFACRQKHYPTACDERLNIVRMVWMNVYFMFRILWKNTVRAYKFVIGFINKIYNRSSLLCKCDKVMECVVWIIDMGKSIHRIK